MTEGSSRSLAAAGSACNNPSSRAVNRFDLDVSAGAATMPTSSAIRRTICAAPVTWHSFPPCAQQRRRCQAAHHLCRTTSVLGGAWPPAGPDAQHGIRPFATRRSDICNSLSPIAARIWVFMVTLGILFCGLDAGGHMRWNTHRTQSYASRTCDSVR
jgi:hypothetical protein